MPHTVISVEHLSKQYDLGVIGTGTLTRDFERWWARVRGKPDPYSPVAQDHNYRYRGGETILALDDVSFTVQQGEALGIIGRNGAGKSTLLKILSRVTAPTSGVVKVKGRIGSLLEVGTGFHPELTGRENVYLNGAILGMKKAEVARKFDEIVAFSGVEKFIDTPVKRFSSGMYVRLAFAVAAHLDPEILIVDEVLAVGDAEFQKKCLGKMGDVAGEGRTVLFVSHNMGSVQNLCPRAVHMRQGKIVSIDETGKVISEYLSSARTPNVFYTNEEERLGTQRVRIVNFSMEPTHPSTGRNVRFILELAVAESEPQPIKADYSISFLTEQGVRIFQLHSGHVANDLLLKPGISRISAEPDYLPLAPGRYYVNLWVGSGRIIYDWIPEAMSFDVEPGGFDEGVLIDNRGYPVVVNARWQQT